MKLLFNEAIVPIGEVSTKLNISFRMLYSWFINTKGILFSTMNSNVSELSDTITRTLETQCDQATQHSLEGNIDAAAAILSEWTVSNHDCVLTNFLNQTTSEIEDELLYIAFTNNSLNWGGFNFLPQV